MSQTKGNTKKSPSAWLAHHKLCFNDALQRQKKDITKSLITWLVISISLLLPTLLYVSLIQLEPLLKTKPDPELSIYIDAKTDNAYKDAKLYVEKFYSDVTVDYISPDEALAQLDSAHGMNTQISFNPLPHTLVVKGDGEALSKMERDPKLIAKIDSLSLDREWIERWTWMVDIGERSLYTISLLLIIGAIATVGNTVALTIVARRHEIEVMSLVGATEQFIRRPFLHTGVLNGAMGGLISCFVLAILMIFIYTPWQHLIHSYNIPATSIPPWVWTFPLLMGITIGAIGSTIACKKHIKLI